MLRKLNNDTCILLALSSLTFLSGSILSSTTALADDSVVDDVSVTVSISCTMSGTGMNTHTATLVNGTYTPDIGTTTLHAFCNDSEGFAIYAAGYTGNDIGTTNSNKLVGTSASNNATIETGLATSAGNPDISNWAMKLTATQDSGDTSGTNAFTIDSAPNTSGGQAASFSQYHVVPNEYTKVAHKNSATDMTASTGGVKLTTTYAAYISKTQLADTYTGQVIYTLVHPSSQIVPGMQLKTTDCPALSICYAQNAYDTIGDMSSLGTITASSTAGKQTTTSGASNAPDITSSTTSIELIAPNFARSGYGFAGWSEDYVANSNSTIYGPNEVIMIEAGSLSTNGKILYPVWIASAGNMQEWSGCANLTAATYNSTTGKVSASLDSLTALTDVRDGNVYTVARLADGKCWMIENLRLDAEHTLGDTNKALAQGYGDATNSAQGDLGKFIGLANSKDNFNTSTPVGKTDPTSANSIYYAGTQSGTATINIMQDYYAERRMPRYNNNNTNMAIDATNSAGTPLVDSFGPDNTNSNVRWFGYGNNYNWPAAMANTGYYTSYYNANGDESQNSDLAGTSICPKGWKLPLGATSTGTINGVLQDEANDSANRVGGFSYLDRKMGGTGANQSSSAGTTQSRKWRSFPNNFVYAGGWIGSRIYSRSARGQYFSSSASRYDTVNALSLYDDILYPGTNSSYNKAGGASVRCIINT